MLLAQQVVDGLDNLLHLALVNSTVLVHIIHLKSHRELLFGVALCGNGDGDEEFGEIYLTTVVEIKDFKNVIAELVRFALRIERLVCIDELDFAQLAFRAIFLKYRTDSRTD